MGRAARHVHGKAILYADKITDSMARAIRETTRRREIQLAHNVEHGITPRSIVKSIDQVMGQTTVADARLQPKETKTEPVEVSNKGDVEETIRELEKLMADAAKNLEFEKAARIRDEIAAFRGEETVADG